MIYRLQINNPEEFEGEKWFASQVEGQFAHIAGEPIPEEWRELLKRLNDASERPSS